MKGEVMDMIGRMKLVVIMITAVIVIVVILLIPMGVKADEFHVQYFSPLPSNSSELDFKFRNIIPTLEKSGSELYKKVKRNPRPDLRPKLELTKSSMSPDFPAKGTSSIPSNLPDHREIESKLSNDSDHVSVTYTYGFDLAKGEAIHHMEDYATAETRKIGKHDVGLFAIFDGYMSHKVPEYVQSHLFENIIAYPDFLFDTVSAVKWAYLATDIGILQESKLDKKISNVAASTATTAMLINLHGQLNYKLIVANVGDSRAIICCKNGIAKQLSIDHDLSNKIEREAIAKRGGRVTEPPGGRVNEILFPLTRAFGAGRLKNDTKYISCEPDVVVEMIDGDTEFLVLASHPLCKAMSNQQVVDSIKQINNARHAAQHLISQARNSPSYYHYDDISCVVVRFQ